VIEGALLNREARVIGSDRRMYDVEKIVNVVSLPKDLRPAEVFVSHSKEDKDAVEKLAEVIEAGGFAVWFDRDLMAGDSFRKVIVDRINSAKAVVVLWTVNSITSRWVIDEANRASEQHKLICLRDKDLKLTDIPPPFSTNDHILWTHESESLLEALARFCRR
jgi:hypothetical protein